MAFVRSKPCGSLDRLCIDDGAPLGEMLPDPQAGDHDDRLDRIAARDRVDGLRRALAALPCRQRQLLIDRWGLATGTPTTIRSMAAASNSKPYSISQAIREAEMALRVRLHAQAQEPDQSATVTLPWPTGPRLEIVASQLRLPGLG